ncbi:MAG: hypothetical protein PHT59_02070 [Candidatus Omnitrophica bacterium]|nr:hypothetical protein [Candidatus Omnitrophota bacterium]
MKPIRVIAVILALLAGVTAFSVVKYLATFKQNLDLTGQVDKLGDEISALEAEKKNLEQDLAREEALKQALDDENAKITQNLQETRLKMAEFESMLHESQAVVEDLDSQISVAKAENAALREQVQELQLSVSQAQADNQSMREKLSSIAELKKAIRQLRRSVRGARQRVAGRIVKERAIIGNAGFVIRNGKSTFSPTSVTIKVEPLPSELP